MLSRSPRASCELRSPLALCRCRVLEIRAFKGWKAPGLCNQHPGAAVFCCWTLHGQEKTMQRAQATAVHEARWGYKHLHPNMPALISGDECCRLAHEGDRLGMNNPPLGIVSFPTLRAGRSWLRWDFAQLGSLENSVSSLPRGEADSAEEITSLTGQKTQHKGKGILKGCNLVLARQRFPNFSLQRCRHLSNYSQFAH